MDPAVSVTDLAKTFALHLQGGVRIPVLEGLSFELIPGECVVLTGASGTGKSTVLKLLYGRYLADGGSILVRHEGRPVELVGAPPRTVLAVRRRTLGYVSQFLRAVPRVPAIDVVAEPLLGWGVERARARERAAALLRRLDIPERLWTLPPATFSGGEQQRVNIARGFINPYPVLLLDEPTASLDARNRAAVVELVDEARSRGAAILGIFHDEDVRAAAADRRLSVPALKAAA